MNSVIFMFNSQGEGADKGQSEARIVDDGEKAGKRNPQPATRRKPYWEHPAWVRSHDISMLLCNYVIEK
jgi:hypothetical protein